MKCKFCGEIIPPSTNGVCVYCWDEDEYEEAELEVKEKPGGYPYRKKYGRRF